MCQHFRTVARTDATSVVQHAVPRHVGEWLLHLSAAKEVSGGGPGAFCGKDGWEEEREKVPGRGIRQWRSLWCLHEFHFNTGMERPREGQTKLNPMSTGKKVSKNPAQ